MTRPGLTMTLDVATHEEEWQRLWFTLQTRQWTSLAIMAMDGSADAERVARNLAALGQRDGYGPLQTITAMGVGYEDVPRVVNHIASQPGSAGQLIVVCDPLRRNPAMIPVLHAVTGVVLVVRLGASPVAAVQQVIDTVGRDKVFASIAVG